MPRFTVFFTLLITILTVANFAQAAEPSFFCRTESYVEDDVLTKSFAGKKVVNPQTGQTEFQVDGDEFTARFNPETDFYTVKGSRAPIEYEIKSTLGREFVIDYLTIYCNFVRN